MIEHLNRLVTDQALLAILPVVSLGAIVAIVGFYDIWRERRNDQDHRAIPK